MRLFLKLIGVSSGILILLTVLFFYTYRKDEEVKTYKKKVLGMYFENIKLKTDFENYKDATQNLRQTKISSQDLNSKNPEIADIINNYSKKTDGDLSIYYKNLTTNEFVTVDGEKKYYMASLYKVILTIYIIDQIKENKIRLEDKIGNPPISIEEALNRIVSESNNEYAETLGEKFGWIKIEDKMKNKLGIDFSFNTNLQANVNNIGFLFEEIALSIKISDMESKYLLKLLSEQKKISKLPKYLPKSIYSHNKTGEFENYSHDAGIFYTPKANYVLVFMSKTEIPYETDERMAQMSKEIYEKLNN